MADESPGAGDDNPKPIEDPAPDRAPSEPPAEPDHSGDKGKELAQDEGASIHAAPGTARHGAGDVEEGEADGEHDGEDDGDDDDSDEDEEDEEDEEPRLKYARLTSHLGPVYRNGDATSAFLVAGDKMIVGTHNGNIHVIQLPIFNSLRVYHAHSASVTSISISPFPPPLPAAKPEMSQNLSAPAGGSPQKPGSQYSDAPSTTAAARKPREPPPVPNTPSNNIYIATSSTDGNVCVQSLVELKDVQLRNFARPVQAVALSPDYKNDRTYLSGGLAGHLILTVGGQPGRSTSTTVGTAAAAAQGWLGNMGIGTSMGKDTVLHTGEGTISTIKWSLSGKFVVWLNEHGIKIMRTKLHLSSADAEDAWKRIGHIDRPQSDEWEAMAAVWKGRAEWIDEQAVETEDDDAEGKDGSPAAERLKQQAAAGKRKVERLVVGWGSTIWIIRVIPGGIGVGKDVGEKIAGRAEISQILRMDCIISGISLYTQNLLLVLAYCLPDDEEDGDEGEGEDDDKDISQKRRIRGHRSRPSTASTGSEPAGGIRRRENNQPPELRLIDLKSQAEVDKDGLNVSRYERLNASDYHLGILPSQAASAVASSRGALEAMLGFGADMWNVAINPKSLFSSGTSVKSRGSGDETASSSKVASTSGTWKFGYNRRPPSQTLHPSLVQPGLKIFIHSPYDCILATKRDLGDHLVWLLEHGEFEQAWELLDENPDIMASAPEKLSEAVPGTPIKEPAGDNFADEASTAADSATRAVHSAAEKEKRRIGDLWIKELIEKDDWVAAGRVCGRVIDAPDRWQKWVWTFASATKFDEITNFIPTEPMAPPIESATYEVVLAYYIQNDKPRLRELLQRWPTELYNVSAVTTALENQLRYRDVREDSVEDGEKGRDWRIVVEGLARLQESDGRHREALKYYIKLQDADAAFRIIRDNHLVDAVADDIPAFIGLRVAADRAATMGKGELEAATCEPITLLVDEAQHGLLRPVVVVSQLLKQELRLYIYFYFRGLWRGDGVKEHMREGRDRLLLETQSLVDEFADLAVQLFATFDRPLLMDFLRTSTSYAFEKAVQECERFQYYDELVYLYSKTGQTKRALYLIIDRLGDVTKAIAFAKEQDDADLWEDLLTYSMDKPGFIRGLLEQVGTAIDPIALVRRIPEGLEIDGLREGLAHIMKEHEIQYSISSGVARVLRSEVAAKQAELRSGQRKGITFEVARWPGPGPAEAKPTSEDDAADKGGAEEADQAESEPPPPPLPPRKGHCAKCRRAFTEWEDETLVGFACGHVFHLTHLLELIYGGEDGARRASSDLGFGFGERGQGYMVGAKVTHARLLRDRIRGGCPVCAKTAG